MAPPPPPLPPFPPPLPPLHPLTPSPLLRSVPVPLSLTQSRKIFHMFLLLYPLLSRLPFKFPFRLPHSNGLPAPSTPLFPLKSISFTYFLLFQYFLPFVLFSTINFFIFFLSLLLPFLFFIIITYENEFISLLLFFEVLHTFSLFSYLSLPYIPHLADLNLPCTSYLHAPSRSATFLPPAARPSSAFLALYLIARAFKRLNWAR